MHTREEKYMHSEIAVVSVKLFECIFLFVINSLKAVYNNPDRFLFFGFFLLSDG